MVPSDARPWLLVPADELALTMEMLTPIAFLKEEDTNHGFLYHSGTGATYPLYRWNYKARPDRHGATLDGQFWTDQIGDALAYRKVGSDRCIHDLDVALLNRLIHEKTMTAYWFSNELDPVSYNREIVIIPSDPVSWKEFLSTRVYEPFSEDDDVFEI